MNLAVVIVEAYRGQHYYLLVAPYLSFTACLSWIRPNTLGQSDIPLNSWTVESASYGKAGGSISKGSLVSGVWSRGIVGMAVTVVGNLAIMVVEGLIVYTQDLRLHVFQWFTKFYSGLGKPFVPVVSKGEASVVIWV